MKKTGLVMEGGAFRGMFTCGVIDVLMEQGITFDGAIGVSAGAAFGCNIASRQIGRAVRYNKKYIRDPRYCSLRNFLRCGDFFEPVFCFETLPFELDPFDVDAFAANPMEFYVVASDVETGKSVYHKCTDGRGLDLTWIRASATIPMLSKVVEFDEPDPEVPGQMKHRMLLDGGMTDSIPLEYFESIGFTRNLVITTRPADYVRPPQKTAGISKILLRRYPRMIEAMQNRHVMYNEQLTYIAEAEKEGRAYVIRPKTLLPIKNLCKDPEKLEECYRLGRSVAMEHLPTIISFLEKE